MPRGRLVPPKPEELLEHRLERGPRGARDQVRAPEDGRYLAPQLWYIQLYWKAGGNGLDSWTKPLSLKPQLPTFLLPNRA